MAGDHHVDFHLFTSTASIAALRHRKPTKRMCFLIFICALPSSKLANSRSSQYRSSFQQQRLPPSVKRGAEIPSVRPLDAYEGACCQPRLVRSMTRSNSSSRSSTHPREDGVLDSILSLDAQGDDADSVEFLLSTPW